LGDGETDLSDRFPGGVFFVECEQGPASMHRLLLDSLLGKDNQDSDVRGTEAQDIKTRLQRELGGRKCLICLDKVQEKEVLSAFRAFDFQGALLVTAERGDIWDGLPDNRKWHIGPDTFWPEANDINFNGGDKIAARVLGTRAENDKSVKKFPDGCEVGPQTLSLGR
jgi:hypothetical protein